MSSVVYCETCSGDCCCTPIEKFIGRDDVQRAHQQGDATRIVSLAARHLPLSQGDLARLCGLSQSMISRVVSGKRQVKDRASKKRILDQFAPNNYPSPLPSSNSQLVGLALTDYDGAQAKYWDVLGGDLDSENEDNQTVWHVMVRCEPEQNSAVAATHQIAETTTGVLDPLYVGATRWVSPEGPEGPQGQPGLDRLTTKDLDWPQVIGHRGAQAVSPENTAAGFDVALAARTQILELDVHLAGDGSLLISHDPTLDRTHGTNVQVRDLFAAAAPTHPIQPGLLGFPSVWEPQPMLTLDNLFARYWSAPVVWLIEIKAYPDAPTQVWEDTTRAVAQVVRRWGLEQASIIQSFNRDAGLAAIAEGFPAGYIETAGTTSPDELIGQGFAFYGMRHDAPEANLAAAVASGMRVLVYTVNRHVDRDRLLDAGADAVVTDDPTYLALERTPSTRDGFKAGTWPPGHLESPVVPVRGELEEGGLVLASPVIAPGDPENYTALTVGHVSPVEDPRNVTINATVALLETDTLTRAAQIHLAVSDVGYDDNNHDRVDAYNVHFRANGTIDIYKAQDGDGILLASGEGPAPVVDVDAPTAMQVQISVDGAGLTARRTDVSPAVEVSAADTSLVAGYVGVGVRSARARFWDLTVH